jgi:hypothetical protein
MTRFAFNVHRVIAGIFVLAIVLSGANYYLDIGFFGRSAKGICLAVLALFLAYALFLAPTRQDMREHNELKGRAAMRKPDKEE